MKPCKSTYKSKVKWFSHLSIVGLLCLFLIQQNQISSLNFANINLKNEMLQTPYQINFSSPTKIVESTSLYNVPRNTLYSNYSVFYQPLGYNSYQAIGSAVGIGKNRLLSAGHVFLESDESPSPGKFKIGIYDEDGINLRLVDLKIINISDSSNLDLALLEVNDELPYFYELEDLSIYNSAKVGDWHYSIGGPMGVPPYHISFGTLTSKDFLGFVLYSLDVAPGNSGGAMYSAKSNKLVGIVVRGAGAITLAVPLYKILFFLHQTP